MHSRAAAVLAGVVLALWVGAARRSTTLMCVLRGGCQGCDHTAARWSDMLRGDVIGGGTWSAVPFEATIEFAAAQRVFAA